MARAFSDRSSAERLREPGELQGHVCGARVEGFGRGAGGSSGLRGGLHMAPEAGEEVRDAVVVDAR